jgi:hypothetical protein
MNTSAKPNIEITINNQTHTITELKPTINKCKQCSLNQIICHQTANCIIELITRKHNYYYIFAQKNKQCSTETQE